MPAPVRLTHQQLVDAAEGWLRQRKWPIVITEMTSGAGETPDAIAFNSFRSVLVECKTSRADFQRDGKKRRALDQQSGMGDERFYLAPAGLLKREELPDGWGLLELEADGKIRMRANPVPRKADKGDELTLLVSLVRRIGQKPIEGVSVRCYTIETERRASVAILPEIAPQ